MKFQQSIVATLGLISLSAALAIRGDESAAVHLQARKDGKRMKVKDNDYDREKYGESDAPEYMKKEADADHKFTEYGVHWHDDKDLVGMHYSVSKDDKAFNVIQVDTRWNNKMSAKDIIIDSWLEEVGKDGEEGDAKDLEYIGYSTDVNEDVEKAVRAAWPIRIKHFGMKSDKKIEEGGTFKVKPDEEGWKEFSERNPFAEGPVSMCKEYEKILGKAKVDEFTVVVQKSTGKPQIDILAKLKR